MWGMGLCRGWEYKIFWNEWRDSFPEFLVGLKWHKYSRFPFEICKNMWFLEYSCVISFCTCSSMLLCRVLHLLLVLPSKYLLNWILNSKVWSHFTDTVTHLILYSLLLYYAVSTDDIVQRRMRYSKVITIDASGVGTELSWPILGWYPSTCLDDWGNRKSLGHENQFP